MSIVLSPRSIIAYHHTIILIVLATVLITLPGAHSTNHGQTIEQFDTKDMVIQSEGFPGPYPSDVNITWRLDADTGQWAVVFYSFVLDKDSNRHEDWLEVDDGDRYLRYTNTTPPPKDLITGPHLGLTFISDRKTDPQSLGFHLHVLYGKTETDLLLRIHEVRKSEERKHGDKEDNNQLLIIVVATLVGIVVVTIVGAVVFVCYRRHHNKDSLDFTSLDIARSPRTRNGSFQPQEIRDNINNQQLHQQQVQSLQQQQQHPRRTSRSSQPRRLTHQTSGDSVALDDVTASQGQRPSLSQRPSLNQHPSFNQRPSLSQRPSLNQRPSETQRPSVSRSNSNASQQMNWMLRAELSSSNALQTADRTSKPNLYSRPPQKTTSTSSDTNNHHSNNDDEETIPYVDVMTPIPDQPSDNSQYTSDYDNFDAVFRGNLSLTHQTCPDDHDLGCSCENLYTNNHIPPAYSSADMAETISSQAIPSHCGNVDSLEKTTTQSFEGIDLKPTNDNNSKSNPFGANYGNESAMLYENLDQNIGSQKDDGVNPGDGFGDEGEENSVYSNLAQGLMGQQKSSPMSVSNERTDSPSLTRGNSSINKIVVSSKQETRTGNETIKDNITTPLKGVNARIENSSIYDTPPPRTDDTFDNAPSCPTDVYINLNDAEKNKNKKRSSSKRSVTHTPSVSNRSTPKPENDCHIIAGHTNKIFLSAEQQTRDVNGITAPVRRVNDNSSIYDTPPRTHDDDDDDDAFDNVPSSSPNDVYINLNNTETKKPRGNSNQKVLSVEQQSRNADDITALTRRISNDRKDSSGIYDTPPPTEDAFENLPSSANDVYINLNHSETTKKKSVSKNSNTHVPVVLNNSASQSQNDSHKMSGNMNSITAATVIPVNKKMQGGASTVYDVPRSSKS